MIERIVSETASRGVGPYSQAIRANGLVFVSGQLGIGPSTAPLVGDADTLARAAKQNFNRTMQFRCREDSIGIREKS